MDLRLTDTNAASDSKGQTWGLEGNLFWWLVGGIGAGITLFFVLIIVVNAGFMTAFGVAVVPVLLCLAYIFGFRQGKPAGYDRDCLEYWLSGAGFSPDLGSTRTDVFAVPQCVRKTPRFGADPTDHPPTLRYGAAGPPTPAAAGSGAASTPRVRSRQADPSDHPPSTRPGRDYGAAGTDQTEEDDV